jgi:hypothetical protein
MHPWRVMAFWLVVGLGGLATACETPDELAALETCDYFCGCIAPLPSENDECVADCQDDLIGAPLSDACVECARESACFEVDQCFETCFP